MQSINTMRQRLNIVIICASLITTQTVKANEALRLCDLALNGCDTALSKAKRHIEIQDNLIASQDDYIDKLEESKVRSENKLKEWETKAPYFGLGFLILGGLIGGTRR